MTLSVTLYDVDSNSAGPAQDLSLSPPLFLYF